MIKRFLTGLCIILAVLFSFSSYSNEKVQASDLPDLLFVDTPQNGSYVTDPLQISGWYVSSHGDREVKIYDGSTYIGSAKLNQYRPDVNKANPGYPTGDYSGFSFSYLKYLSPGTHSLEVFADSTPDDPVDAITQTITVTKAPQLLYVDSPANNQTFKGDITISGWSLNASGIKEVDILDGNNLLGKAITGLDRPDVQKAINTKNQYLNGSKSGYTYAIGIDTIGIGAHTLKVRSIGNDNEVSEQTMSLSISKPSPLMNIDTPIADAYMNSRLGFGGWSVDASGIKEVDVNVDGKKIGQARIGIQRDDVNRIINNNGTAGYKNAEYSGYNVDLPCQLTGGIHTVQVISVGNDGDQVEKDFSINKLKPDICIDTPQNNSILSLNSGNFNIYGWALNYFGTKRINMLVDGTMVGQATLGLYRPDVNNAYPGYTGGSNSGFSYALNLNAIAPGSHELTVQSVSADDEITERSITIVLGNSSVDPHEPNNDTISGAFELKYGSNGVSDFTNFINNANDVDYFKVYRSTTNDFLEVLLSKPSKTGTNSYYQYTVTLYDPDENIITVASSGFSQDFVRCKIKKDGYYYIKVNGDSYNYSSSCPYGLTIR